MAEDREREVLAAFVALANTLVRDFDAVDLFTRLTEDCAQLLDVQAAGFLLADSQGELQVIAASSAPTRTLELYQLQSQEGPCVDCYATDARVFVPDLAEEGERWPRFVEAALGAGFRSVHALPMRLRGVTLGALGLFGPTTGELDDTDIELAQALAHVAAVALVTDAVAIDRTRVNEQLQAALTSRIVIEQAKGLIANAGDLSLDDAFVVLRGYARDHNLRLSVLARDVAGREVELRPLIEHCRSAQSRNQRRP